MKRTHTGLHEVIGQKALYASVQQSQGVSASNYTPNILLTGYETVIAHRTSELYSKPAKQDGKITKINKQGMVIEYKDGSRDSFPLGLVIGEASGEYHRHNRVTDYVEGHEFKKGDILGWDEMYFARDFANPTQVAWKCGVMTRIGLGETQFTYEDSVQVDAEWAAATVTSYLKPEEFTVGIKEGLHIHHKVGDEVDYDTILCTIEDEHLIGISDDESEFAGLARHGLKQIKSGHHGKIVKFEAIYNGSLDDMSDSVRAFIKSINDDLKSLERITQSGITDANVGVNGSIGRAPVEPGFVNIRIFIDYPNASEMADKFVAGNQMKGTVGNIVNKSMRTLDGRKVPLLFSFKGLYNRMVLSLRNKMAACEVTLKVTELAIKAYRGK